MKTSKILHRQMRKRRIRARLRGTSERPRLTVYRSLKAISAQIIDDTTRRTLVAAHSRQAKAKGNREGAKKVGALLAERAKEKGITAIVFDRNAYAYHGAVKALADAARSAGLLF